MIWRGYVDDSGNRGHSEFLVLGGFISPQARWLEFTVEWENFLALPPRLDYLKMAEANVAAGQFQHWSSDRIDARLSLAYEIIEKYCSLQVSCVIKLPDSYELFTSELFEKNAINPYYLAFSSIMFDTAASRRLFGIGDTIDFVFDNQVMEKGKIQVAWDSVKARHKRSRLNAGELLGFFDDVKFLPLQAADMAAWCIRFMAENPAAKIRFPWRPTRQIPGFQFVYDRERLTLARDEILRQLRASD